MPSGAKKKKKKMKKKGARRKQEMGIHPPDSPTNPSPGNCESPGSKGGTSDEGAEKKCESPRSESIAVAAMDSSENGKEKPSEETSKVTENPPKEEKEKVVEEETVPIAVTREADDVSVELVQPVKEESGGGGGGGEGPTEVAEEKSATVASVIPVDEPVYVTEEVVEATEAATATSEALSRESEVKPVPVSEIPPASATEQARPREGGEVCQESERSEVVPVPLVEHRATWWNCCGLFDVFTSSKDATRT